MPVQTSATLRKASDCRVVGIVLRQRDEVVQTILQERNMQRIVGKFSSMAPDVEEIVLPIKEEVVYVVQHPSPHKHMRKCIVKQGVNTPQCFLTSFLEAVQFTPQDQERWVEQGVNIHVPPVNPTDIPVPLVMEEVVAVAQEVVKLVPQERVQQWTLMHVPVPQILDDSRGGGGFA